MSDKTTLHLIDTCSLVNVRDVYGDSGVLWDKIFTEIEAGRLKTVRQVAGELERRFPIIHLKLKPYRKKLIIPDGDAYRPEVIAEIRAIQAAHPSLYRLLGAQNPADPWLISVGKHLNGVVVTDEKVAGAKHRSKIPWVCKNRNVGCVSGLRYFELLGYP